jgi:ABC-type spermidine/putrescine transport system permease subunit II
MFMLLTHASLSQQQKFAVRLLMVPIVILVMTSISWRQASGWCRRGETLDSYKQMTTTSVLTLFA